MSVTLAYLLLNLTYLVVSETIRQRTTHKATVCSTNSIRGQYSSLDPWIAVFEPGDYFWHLASELIDVLLWVGDSKKKNYKNTL